MSALRLFPTSLAEIAPWAKAYQATEEEARHRFVQFVLIESIARGLPGRLSFKGGNALRFCYESPRGTTDIDYTAVSDIPDDPEGIRGLIDGALRNHSPEYGIACKVHSVRRNPKRSDATRPTYRISVAWALPGFRQFPGFLESAEAPTAFIPVEVSLNDVVCETVPTRLGETNSFEVTVCALEDIVAEKLRALLQQIPRNRTRPQDVYDIARIVRSAGLDRGKVAKYFVEKCRDRAVVPAKSSFVDEVRDRASIDYALKMPSGSNSIPFSEAWEAVVTLVADLPIPD